MTALGLCSKALDPEDPETLSEPITPHTLQHITNTDIYIFALPVSYWLMNCPWVMQCRPESGHPPVMKLPRPPSHINKHPCVLIKWHLKARRGADIREDNPNHRGWNDNSERGTNDHYHSALVERKWRTAILLTVGIKPGPNYSLSCPRIQEETLLNSLFNPRTILSRFILKVNKSTEIDWHGENRERQWKCRLFVVKNINISILILKYLKRSQIEKK